MFVCWHMGWSVERDFMTLSAREQNDWLAWGYQEQEKIHDAVRNAYEPVEGKVYSEIVAARFLHALATSGGISG